MIAELQIESSFPREIVVNKIAISFEALSKPVVEAQPVQNL